MSFLTLFVGEAHCNLSWNLQLGAKSLDKVYKQPFGVLQWRDK